MMKTNVQVKDEPVELQVDKLLRLYAYQTTRTKSIGNQEQEPSTCAWCQKLGTRSFTLQTDNGDSKTLCSEVCFNQYRRASFKKNKGSEIDVDQNISTMKKLDKKKREQQLIESNRRKIFIPHRHPTPSNTKPKTNEVPRIFSPSSSSSSSSKRHRSSSPPSLSNGKVHRVDQTSLTPSNLPVSLTWQPSLFLPSTLPWSSPFSYPYLPPPPPPPPPLPLPPALPIPSSSSSTSPSDLFTTLSKGTLSNYTCILPTFIPLPIPIPIPLCLPCNKCSVEVKHQQSQTISEDNKQTRRMSV